MFDKFIYWSKVVLSPVVAAMFGYYIYAGHEATVAVWAFAYFGILHMFFDGIRGIANAD